MSKYRFTIRSEYVTRVDITADNEIDAILEMEAYLEAGGTGDNSDNGEWEHREYDEPEKLCLHCNEPVENLLGLFCCQKAIEEARAKIPT